MYTVEELNKIINKKDFISDFQWVQQSLANLTVLQESLFDKDVVDRLNHFIEAVMCSLLDWDGTTGKNLARVAAEIAEILANYDKYDGFMRKRMRFRAALLYEVSGMTNLAKAIIDPGDFTKLRNFFQQKGSFGLLSELNTEEEFFTQNGTDFLELALTKDVADLSNYLQGNLTKYPLLQSYLISKICQYVNLPFNATDILVYEKVLKKRLDYATFSNVNIDIFKLLKKISFPAELWEAQISALRSGLLNPEFDSWGLAAPTGTGKTFITRLLIIDTLLKKPDSKIFYLVPSRALVYEVSTNLEYVLKELEIDVLAVSSQLTELGGEENDEFENASVVVLTPEKADLLLRIGRMVIDEVSLVIIDEAHHIEADTRGVLLELYLLRLKKLIPINARFVFLSAVTPNISQLTNWLGTKSNSTIVDDRATRMRVGVYKIKKNNQGSNEGWIEYADETKLRIVDKGVESSSRRALVQLCEKVQISGTVLTVAKGKKECEKLAREMQQWLLEHNRLNPLNEIEQLKEEYKRLDSRLEREMYPTVEMRTFLLNRIVYHHAGLPPRVRIAVEDAIRCGIIDYVFATTTLAEGVNFPFTTVIVQSLALREPPDKGIPSRYKPITPRTFWNIAGRAGRPGYDKEGQVILFEPTLGLDKVSAVLENYLNPNLKEIHPVTSALSNSISDIKEGLNAAKFELKDLDSVEFKEEIPKRIKGAINLLRVGLVHAKAEKILEKPEEIIESSFAYLFLNDEDKKFSIKLIKQQAKVVEDFFKTKGAPSETIVAEMGLSLDTISQLQKYVSNLEDWQIKNFSKLFFGSTLNLEQAPFIIGPVSARIAELEGTKLGGFLSNVIVSWVAGTPLTVIQKTPGISSFNRLEDLISVIYSRVQFLLPWGLYAVHNIVQEEAENRKINYGGEILSLSYLADAGVPTFEALRLVNLQFERVDATRLANYYHRISSKIRSEVDIIGWLKSLDYSVIIQIVRGIDNRGVDYDLPSLIKSLSET